MECIQTVNYLVIINGESSPPFNAAKGLRQRDPISPYLFDIAMEYLRAEIWRGWSKITHLSSILDVQSWNSHTLLLQMIFYFSLEDIYSLSKQVITALIFFSQAFRLKANLDKSVVYFFCLRRGRSLICWINQNPRLSWL